MLVIAHRLSTIQNADVIAVVTEGVIAEVSNAGLSCFDKTFVIVVVTLKVLVAFK